MYKKTFFHIGLLALAAAAVGVVLAGYAAILGEHNDRAGAEAGEPDAMAALADRFRTGEGEPQSYKKAYDLYRLAALEGHAGAMYWLGGFYWHGWEIEKDYEKAVDWYQRAAEAGSEQSRTALQELGLEVAGVAPDQG